MSGDSTYASTIHDWQPVSSNINTLTFSHPTIGSVNNNILDIDINFVSQTQSSINLDFRKRIHLKNKSLISSSTQCDNKCPNSRDIFANYNISSNETHWDPDTNTVPSATVLVSENYVQNEDKLQWDTSLASNLGLTVTFIASTGILEIRGTTSAANYQKFIRTINYVNTVNDINNRTTHTDIDRRFILSLGFGTLTSACGNLIGREVGSVRHFYCYVHDTTNGKGGKNQSGPNFTNGALWWGEAKLQAEGQRYYNLEGYLASITSDAENNYVLDKIRDSNNQPIAAWFGGTDNPGIDRDVLGASEGVWVWSGGPEKGQIFWNENDSSDNVYEDWRGANDRRPGNGWQPSGVQPDDCCSNLHNSLYTQTTNGGLAPYTFDGYTTQFTQALVSGISSNPQGTVLPLTDWATNSAVVARINNVNYSGTTSNISGVANRYVTGLRSPNATVNVGSTKRLSLEHTLQLFNMGNISNIVSNGGIINTNGTALTDAAGNAVTFQGSGGRTYNVFGIGLRNASGYRHALVFATRTGGTSNNGANDTLTLGTYTGEHYPTVGGEHYTQFSNQNYRGGYWNDLYLPGVNWSPFGTYGYVLEFSTNFPSPPVTCGDGSAKARSACANYFSSFNLVLDDTSYTSPDMLDLCDANPADSVIP